MSEVKLTTEQFLALSKSEKRVVLAKDVIEILRANKIIARRSTYFDMYKNTSFDPVADEIEINEMVGKVKCEACAIGGLFIAEVMYTDKAKVGDAHSSHFIKRRLKEYFEERQLGLIETAFEGNTELSRGKGYSDDEIEAAANYTSLMEFAGGNEVSSKDAMTLIMQNIIENNGVFVP